MKRFLQGALYGAVTGLIYGLAEYAVVITAPMLRWAPCSLIPDHWKWEAAFLSLYLVLGAAIGAAATLVRRADPGRAATRAVAAAALIALVAGRLLSQNTNAAGFVLDAADLSLAALLIASIFLWRSRTWVGWFCSPWMSIPLLFALTKLNSRIAGAPRLALAIVALLAAAAIVLMVASRMAFLRRALENRFLPITVPACLVLLIALPAYTKHLDRLPPIPAGHTAAAASHNQPNVLLIVLDTVRADHLSLYGYERRTTPNLETLARDSVVFRNAVSASDVTLTSHASIYTGMYPSWHGAYLTPPTRNGDPLGPSLPTLAGVLSQHGYTTMAVLANSSYLRPLYGMNRGFQLYDVRTPISGAGAAADYYVRDLIRPLFERVTSTAELDREFRRGDQITSDGLHILETMRRTGAPFFLNLNYMDAHDPYLPPPPYRDLFPGRIAGFPNRSIYELRRQLALLRHPPELDADLVHIRSQYDGGLAYLDAQLNQLFEGLKRLGLYDNTLIVLTADHGEALGERNILGHPAWAYQDLVHVPLVVKYPHADGKGTQVETPVSAVDLMPTILDVTGTPAPAGLQGQSLRKVAEARAEPVMSESFPDHLSELRRRTDNGARALYQGNWKFIGATNGQKELYDLSRDPNELHNLYNPEDAVSRQLSDALDKVTRAIPSRRFAPKQVDRDTLERLRSLGYVQR